MIPINPEWPAVLKELNRRGLRDKDILDAMANLPRLWRGGGHAGGGVNDIRRLNEVALQRYRQSRGIA